jgi:hypothetical protein
MPLPAASDQKPIANRSLLCPNGSNPAQVMSLKSLRDFLMHGVVLQNRMLRPASAMFHVKHFCVKAGFRAWP